MSKDIFDSFNKIKVGDRVYIEGNGPCSGGARYGLHDKVVKITKRDVITDDGSAYSRKTGRATKPPFAYFIEFWRKKTKSKKKRNNKVMDFILYYK